MEKMFKSKLNGTSQMLLHWVQEVRKAVKKEDEIAAISAARDALNMASWVITYAAAIKALKYEKRKEQE